jgi:hypothetical protein
MEHAPNTEGMPADELRALINTPGLAFRRLRIVAEETARIVQKHKPDTTSEIVSFFLGARRLRAPNGFVWTRDGDELVVLLYAGKA